MILLLGYGFFGKVLYKHLASNGYQVKVLSKNLPYEEQRYFRSADLANLHDYVGFFEDINLIIHTIHTTVPATSMKNLEGGCDNDANFALSLLQLMEKRNITKIIYLSSGGAVYGNPDSHFVNESHPTNPLSEYGISKLTVEKYIQQFHKKYMLDYIILRPSNFYGADQSIDRPHGILGHVINAAQNNKTIDIWGDGNGKKDYLHVGDMADAVLRVIEKFNKHKNDIFNVASGFHYSVNNIVEIVERLWGNNVTKRYLPQKDYDVQNILLNGSHFNDTFDYEAEMKIEKFVELNREANSRSDLLR